MKAFAYLMTTAWFRWLFYHIFLNKQHTGVGSFDHRYDSRDSDNYLALFFRFGGYDLAVEIHKEFETDRVTTRYVSMKPWFSVYRRVGRYLGVPVCHYNFP